MQLFSFCFVISNSYSDFTICIAYCFRHYATCQLNSISRSAFQFFHYLVDIYMKIVELGPTHITVLQLLQRRTSPGHIVTWIFKKGNGNNEETCSALQTQLTKRKCRILRSFWWKIKTAYAVRHMHSNSCFILVVFGMKSPSYKLQGIIVKIWQKICLTLKKKLCHDRCQIP